MNTRLPTLRSSINARHVLQLRGFALVITLSLMLLLAILAVGLLSLSSIALRSASQGSAISMARNNARIAMVIALGQLQKAAGQDQRITAAADFAGDTGGVRLDSGKAPRNDTSLTGIANGMSMLRPGTRYWTGVWNTVTTSAPPALIYTKHPSATGVQWLISGNELEATTPQKHTPSTQLIGLGSNGTVADSSKSVVLVGTSTVGPATATNINNFVAAPLVPISIPNPLGGDSLGRYAWWIGDEGVKARINRAAPTSANDAATYQTLANQRAGWEVVMPSYPTPASNSHGLLERVITLPEAELLHSSLETSSGTPAAMFHTASSDTFGVLADSLQGGLRLDLTAYLKNGFPSSAQSTFPNAPKKNTNIIPLVTDKEQKVSSNLKGPKWDILKAFYAQSKSLSSGKLTVKAAANLTELTIAPIIVDLRLLMGVKVVAIDANSYKLNPCGKIAVSLANPYPYTLEWKANLELEIIDQTPFQTGNSSRIWDASGRSGFLGRKNEAGVFDRADEPGVFNRAVFLIPKGELAPGEAKAFTLSGAVLRPANDVSQIKVTLSPFSSSSPSDFNNCVELVDDKPNSGGRALDVRESWTASQPTAELRLEGGSSSTTPLRRLERFELDNAFYASVRRGVDNNTATSMPQPFPLHLFSFQMSQPGADYGSLMPSADLMGTRSTTLRTFTDFNLQAVRFGKLITSYNPPPYFMESTDSLASLPFNPPGGETGIGFTRNLAISPLAWGRAPVGNCKKTILFTFPKSFVSLAQLQHADLTATDEFVNVSQQPGNAFGNSYATPFVKRQYVIQPRENYIVTGGSPSSTSTTVNYYDIAYLLNATLWDTFYFSTIGEDASSASEPLNRSITILNNPASSSSLKDPVTAASYLLINGAFNVNSTSKDAWKALLAGNRFLKHPADVSSSAASNALFPRSLEQRSPNITPPSGTGEDSFAGYRRLTNTQIDAIAEELVKQVRLRGPFVSLSHFVNRALLDLSASNATSVAMGRSGALQSALDLSGANISPDAKKSAFSGNLSPIEDKVRFQLDQSAPKADMWGGRGNGDYFGTTKDGLPVWAPQSKDLNPGAVASIVADRNMLTDNALLQEQGFRSTGIPGWITQADVLQVIGPSIAARSDTFRIRSYGEALGTDGKTVLAKAWCEAIVQRVPSYIDSTDAATKRAPDLTKLNTLFGRRFEIVSFRWLSENEI